MQYQNDNSKHTITETFNAALTNIIYYYKYVKSTYVDTALEHISEISTPALFLWQSTGQISIITYSQKNQEVHEDNHDHINWAALFDEDDEKTTLQNETDNVRR